MPFLFAPAAESQCETMLPIVVYAGYGAYLAISIMVEMITYLKVKSSLKLANGSSMMTCNSYLFVKQFQGQLGNLDTYVHICYVASLLKCFTGSNDDDLQA